MEGNKEKVFELLWQLYLASGDKSPDTAAATVKEVFEIFNKHIDRIVLPKAVDRITLPKMPMISDLKN